MYTNTCTADKASAPATWPYLEADAWAVYYEWDRRPLRALVAKKLNASTTLCNINIGEHDKLDDVNLLQRQCDDRYLCGVIFLLPHKRQAVAETAYLSLR